MYILAIETTGPLCSVALVSEDENKKSIILAEETSTEAMNHLQELIPLTQKLFQKAGVEKSALTHIAVSQGPGSFTGIRIGVSTARALGQAMNLPVIGIPTLEAFKYKDEADKDAVICGILNARRGQVYGIVEGYLEGCPCMLTDVLEILAGPVHQEEKKVLFFGDGIDAYEEKIKEILGEAGMKLGQEYDFAPEACRYQNAASVGRMACEKALAGEGLHYNDLHPEYMRKAEAEQKLEAGQLPICKLPKQE